VAGVQKKKGVKNIAQPGRWIVGKDRGEEKRASCNSNKKEGKSQEKA